MVLPPLDSFLDGLVHPVALIQRVLQLLRHLELHLSYKLSALDEFSDRRFRVKRVPLWDGDPHVESDVGDLPQSGLFERGLNGWWLLGFLPVDGLDGVSPWLNGEELRVRGPLGV